MVFESLGLIEKAGIAEVFPFERILEIRCVIALGVRPVRKEGLVKGFLEERDKESGGDKCQGRDERMAGEGRRYRRSKKETKTVMNAMKN